MVSKRGLNPKFPVVQGRHQLNAAWSLELPGEFNRRIEDGDLVLWRPGMTMFIAIWNNDRGESIPARLEWLREDMNPAAFDHVEETDGTSQRFAYRLAEDGDDDRVPALYGFTVADSSHVQLAVYFDSEDDTATALELWRSVASAEQKPDP
jgi:hypothetical protein